MSNIIKQNTLREKLTNGLFYSFFFSLVLIMYFFTDYEGNSTTQSSTTQSVTEEENQHFPDYSNMVYNHIESTGKTITFWNGRTGKNLYKGIFLNRSTGTTHAFGVWVDRNGNIIKVEVR